ncbi:BLUF domain-containing protein [uncultured Thiohalocapsa sp.]|uniref:BLUF domain-containing protein n=1 Tax=uncultured Thiohalocapsa sp. TaxID=768990 RepID=UPI0025FA28C9|nr:BLUF domain-containing protein [uncultured Thiohalocapsa sp.]
MIFQLCYLSNATRDMQREDLVDLLSVSRRKNEALGITGLLLYSGDRFIQLLEGEEAAVRELYALISKDERHRDVTLVYEEHVQARTCPDWTMGFQAMPESEWLEFPSPDGSERGLRPMLESMSRAKAVLRSVAERGLDPARGL